MIAELPRDEDIQGEYAGTLGPDSDALNVGVPIIALGNLRFRAVLYRGGLPGAGWNRGGRIEAEATVEKNQLTFLQGDMRIEWSPAKCFVRLEARGGDDPMHDGHLDRIVRTSPTLGQAPPPGVVVLFDGTSVDRWEGDGGSLPRMSHGVLHPGVLSRFQYGDHRLHLEFRTPFTPLATGQSRGNSGVYIDGRYEIQILDSFGLSGEQNECGGVFGVARPDQNLCYPPGQWQTLDVEFLAP